MIRFLLCASALASTLTLAACGQSASVETAPPPTPASQTSQAMVAAANPLAVEAGLDALRAGGDAIDAAIAVQTVLGLVEPQSSGLGGGAFMLYYDASTGDLTAYDGRETAPASATPTLFLDEDGQPLSFYDAVFSGHSVGAPGAIAMLALAHGDHGELPWANGFQAAIGLAENGFAVSPRLQGFIAGMAPRSPIDEWPASRAYFFLEDGSALPVGYQLHNQAYADSARAIAADWRNLYSGPLAAEIVQAVQAEPRPGGLTQSDLAGYQALRREAVCRAYRQWTVCGMPPPASGGVTVNEILGLLEPYDMAATGPQTLEGWRRFIEASRLAYADRDAYVADPEFVTVPVEGLLASDYITTRSNLVAGAVATPHVVAGIPAGIAAPGVDATPDSPGTSHLVIVDNEGDVISMTTTVESVFGSQRMAGGFFLNNQLTDFSRIPIDADGQPIPNAPAAGKRPRSSMSPTIVFDANGHFVLATGSPGGSSIIAYTAKTLVGMLDWGLTPQQAIELPNVVANGDIVRIEDGMPANVLAGLQDLGFTLDANRGENSGIHIVRRLEDGTLIGGADPRREGVALQP
ncbi:gamma-glutamyltransferase family protein [uncultured Maricaulis sp.]|uniref:gamma-glutamyltransferase family protein n=1 Tax=uncultured Maricaulis sp. TaxID=174710 RepID=UPI0030DB2BD0|tara:strand:+ start:48926 stop:50659 length:1734 start_codon:yes stop_codon:yes gene_type:complete